MKLLVVFLHMVAVAFLSAWPHITKVEPRMLACIKQFNLQ